MRLRWHPTDEEFDRVVEMSIASLPERFKSLVENLVVSVEQEPSARDLGTRGHSGEELLGIFRGIPLPDRSWDLLPMLPNEVVIFRGPISRVSRTRGEALEQIRETVIHELGHYFGLSDEEMIY